MFYAIYGLGLPPIEAGSLIFLFAISDAIFDIPAAFLMYRFQHKMTMAIWVTLATPCCSLLLLIIFTTFFIQPDSPEFIKWVVVGLLFKLAFTFVDIPLNAAIGQFEYSSKKRNYIAASRSIASTVAKLAIAFMIVAFVETNNAILTEKLWIVALIIAIAAPVLIIPTFNYIDNCAKQLDFKHKYHSGDIKIKQILGFIPKNLKLLLITNFFVLVLIGQFSHGLIFLVEKNPNFNISFSTAWQFMAIVSALTVIPWMYLASKINKNKAAMINLLLLALLLACYPKFIHSQYGLVAFVGLFASLQHINSLIWSMLPDAADEISAEFESNMHIPTIGLFAAIGKSMIGLGLLLSGFILDYSGFPDSPDVSLYSNIIISLTLAGGISAAATMGFYRVKTA
jgi:Na+/melibiose symporter-like transporter